MAGVPELPAVPMILIVVFAHACFQFQANKFKVNQFILIFPPSLSIYKCLHSPTSAYLSLYSVPYDLITNMLQVNVITEWQCAKSVLSYVSFPSYPYTSNITKLVYCSIPLCKTSPHTSPLCGV